MTAIIEPAILSTVASIRTRLLLRQEIVVLDVRDEDSFAKGHPLFAAQIPFGRLDVEARWRIPRLDTPIVVYDNGKRLADRESSTIVL